MSLSSLLRSLVLCAGGLAALIPVGVRAQSSMPQVELTVGMFRIEAEVAATLGDRMQGLMQRRQMAAGGEPLMNLHLFADRQFTMGSIVAFIYGTALFGSTYLLPVYLQMGLGLAASYVGGLMLPAGFVLAATIAMVGRLADRHPTYLLVSIGLALLAGCSQAPSQPDKHSGLALANMDTRVKPGDDFFRYVNGHWLATAKIPDDRPADGAFYLLRDKSLADVRVLVEGLDGKAATGTPAQARQNGHRTQASKVAKAASCLCDQWGACSRPMSLRHRV